MADERTCEVEATVVTVQSNEIMYGNRSTKNVQLLFKVAFLKHVKHQHGGCVKSVFRFVAISNDLLEIIL
jgi:hypothetical protein